MLIPLLTTIHVLVCLFLIGVVLLQSGKAADLAGAFGGMGSQTAFGPRGTATMLSKWTTIAAGLFMVTSLSLAVLQTRTKGTQGSVIDKVKPQQQTTPQPVTGTTPPATPGSIGVTTSGPGMETTTKSIPLPMPQTQGADGKPVPPPAPVPAPAPAQKAPAPAPAAK